MRDISRIDKFCDELKTIWKEVPDWRFGQLMLNVFGEYYDKVGDPFFAEETEMMEFLKKMFKMEDNK